MKKNLLNTLVAVSMVMGINMSTPQKADALLLVAVGSGGTGGMDGAGMLLCLVLLPICILDKHQGDQNMTAKDLVDNGYTKDEIQQIMSDQQMISTSLKAKNLKIVVGSTDNSNTLERDIRKVYPGVSQTYLKFLAENNVFESSNSFSRATAR